MFWNYIIFFVRRVMLVIKIYIKFIKCICGNSLESLGVYLVLRKYYVCMIFFIEVFIM